MTLTSLEEELSPFTYIQDMIRQQLCLHLGCSWRAKEGIRSGFKNLQPYSHKIRSSILIKGNRSNEVPVAVVVTVI